MFFSIIRKIDWLVVVIVLILLAFSLLNIYSVTAEDQGTEKVLRQLAWIGIGLVILISMTIVDYHTLSAFAYPFYFLILVALTTVLAIGPVVSGSQRWIRFGGFSIQPSEFAKLAMILVLARYFSNKKRGTISFIDVILTGILLCIPLALILKQPDLGTALVLLPIYAAILFIMGLDWKYFVIAGILGICAMPLMWQHLKPYQKNRIISFINPNADPLGSGYHVIQSEIAIGSGGFWGKGYMRGSQTRLNFIPEQFTDFIFSVVGEEWGFVGTIGLLILYFTLIYRGLYIASKARDRLGALIAIGVIAMLIMHVTVNIGMCIGIMPVTGVPLPFMSYGGSAILSNLAGIGLLLNIQIRRFMF
ncbi:MAG TPA: rod shape-determining protein RodA [Candidatus Limnocylindrales bacterium]|nr:rod shape-determining protein RodA [Candidatus Limnocylindrales bacterium]